MPAITDEMKNTFLKTIKESTDLADSLGFGMFVQILTDDNKSLVSTNVRPQKLGAFLDCIKSAESKEIHVTGIKSKI